MEQEEGDIYVADSKDIKTVHDIQQQVISLKPDFVIVDGAYKLAGTEWKDSSALIQSLCDYSGSGKAPWLATSQLNIEANEAKGGREKGYNARGNKNWYTDSDSVLAITQSPELAQLGNVIRLDCVKDREAGDKTGIADHFHLTMDMNFTKISVFDLDSYKDEEILAIT